MVSGHRWASDRRVKYVQATQRFDALEKWWGKEEFGLFGKGIWIMAVMVVEYVNG